MVLYQVVSRYATRILLRLEGGAVLIVALGSYLWLDGPLWMLLILALAPDLSMIGYIAGNRIGSMVYNLVHTYLGPLALITAALWSDTRIALLIGLVWIGHIGADRLLRYGLKYESGFGDTHLS